MLLQLFSYSLHFSPLFLHATKTSGSILFSHGRLLFISVSLPCSCSSDTAVGKISTHATATTPLSHTENKYKKLCAAAILQFLNHFLKHYNHHVIIMYFMGNTRSGLAFMVRTHAQLPHSSLTLILTIMHAYNQHTFYNIFNLHHSKKSFKRISIEYRYTRNMSPLQ